MLNRFPPPALRHQLHAGHRFQERLNHHVDRLEVEMQGLHFSPTNQHLHATVKLCARPIEKNLLLSMDQTKGGRAAYERKEKTW